MRSSDITEQAIVTPEFKTYMRRVSGSILSQDTGYPAYCDLFQPLRQCWSGTFNYRMTASFQIYSY
jgi:hypothetical protein